MLRAVLAFVCLNWAFVANNNNSHGGGGGVGTAMAVDRSKFRTCQQTSFCRRHRNGHSGALYRYRLLPGTVELHIPTPEEKAAAAAAAEEAKKQEGGGGVWKSFQRRLLGGEESGNGDGSDGAVDPYVRGPTPTLTGTLENAASGGQQQKEVLSFSVTALADGLARMRVTETYGGTSSAGTAYEKARVTYDDLVLHEPGSWTHAEHVLWLRPPAPEDDSPAESEASKIFSKIIGGGKKEWQNYMALEYGDAPDASNMILLIQLDPFVVSMYRKDDIDKSAAGGGGWSLGHKSKPDPIVVLGAQDMMYFEVRRFKDEAKKPAGGEDEAAGGEEGDKKEEEDKNEGEGEGNDKKTDKEIVGYWEDGLAIYADGTREEKKKEDVVEEDHRQLTEEEELKLDREGMWEESFSSHRDSKPHGPMSVGMDVAFPRSLHLYGIPEHASSAALKTTLGDGAHYKDPYRLYNLDVFEYELDETMALYGSIPFVVSQSAAAGTVGVFWFNPTETFVDVMQDPKSKKTTTHWMSESGVMDVFLAPGPDPHSLYRQYARLTGTSALPPMFSIGYHQCRWNYKDEKDVYDVHAHFEDLDYPYDVLWLDIEHTDGKRYFTWDKGHFPNPKVMQEKLAAQGRRMVTIIDPHMKRDDNYYIHKEATAKGLYVKDKEGKADYDGWCWPGSSSYLDFTAEHVRSWWADQFAYKKYQGSTPTLFTWNDMNEPSVFNGPEVSMQKDLLNLKGEEHREWHNLYGMLFHRATAEGQIRRNPGEDVRPFVLSRAFFAGTQKYGAIWTGDNTAEWGHLEVAAPMLLSLNSAALSFVGADVGGFFGDPDAELFTRWMQAGAYQPFFRGHAHHDSKRREPWTFDEDTLGRLRRSAMERYALLPFWYTVFREAETTGMPVMRMMWMQYPDTEQLYDIDDQYLIGSDLLVKPVTAAGVAMSTVLIPTDDIWYNAATLELVPAGFKAKSVKSMNVPSPIDLIPVFQRGGSIIPRKLRLRRSTMLMKSDPYTLYVALDNAMQARGELYMDDEETFGYQTRAENANATFTADFSSDEGFLKNEVTVGSGWTEHVDNLVNDRQIERIIIMGMKKSPKSISLGQASLEFSYNAGSSLVVVRKPEVPAISEWSISFQMI